VRPKPRHAIGVHGPVLPSTSHLTAARGDLVEAQKGHSQCPGPPSPLGGNTLEAISGPWAQGRLAHGSRQYRPDLNRPTPLQSSDRDPFVWSPLGRGAVRLRMRPPKPAGILRSVFGEGAGGLGDLRRTRARSQASLLPSAGCPGDREVVRQGEFGGALRLGAGNRGPARALEVTASLSSRHSRR